MNTDVSLTRLLNDNMHQIKTRFDYLVVYFHRWLLGKDFFPINKNQVWIICFSNIQSDGSILLEYRKDDINVSFLLLNTGNVLDISVQASGQGSEYQTTMQSIVIDQYVQENSGNFSYKDNELPDLRDRLRKKFYNVTSLIKQKMIHASTDTSRPSSMPVTTVDAKGYSNSCVPKPSTLSSASDFMEKDYYRILGVHRRAPNRDIISAYQQLASEFHLSRNPTDFNDLGEAYDVLIDSNKRGIYDRYGIQGLKTGVLIGPNNELTERYVFHGDDLYASAYARAAEPAAHDLKRKHGAPLYRDLEVSLENCYYGGTFDVTITRRVMLVDGTSTTPQKVVPITIERGCLPVIRDLEHPRFRRENVDLIYKATISLEEELTGTKLYIQHLDGRQLEVPINEIVASGLKQRIPNEGMPSTSNPGAYGDLIIGFSF
ncbi:unnamed protein product [Rotaria socialis]|uniref:J domain-containing protein n=1 Tax=Rotaria socialis TaxID=392032 RepID=A0A821UN10_9BILA|nr:unnamed protein product [Rotaria socialis]